MVAAERRIGYIRRAVSRAWCPARGRECVACGQLGGARTFAAEGALAAAGEALAHVRGWKG
jgi:hypothetical protein